MSRTSTRRRTRVPPIIGGVVLMAAIAIALATTGGDSDTPSGRTEPTVAGILLPEHDLGSIDDPAVGQLVPNLVGFDFDGTTVNPTRNERAKLFVFLAHWCTHCQAELPILVDWIDSGGAGELQVVGVVTLTDPLLPNHPPRPWLEEAGWPGEVIVDGEANQIAEAFGLSATPFFVVTDADDRVVARAAGELPVAELEALVAAAG